MEELEGIRGQVMGVAESSVGELACGGFHVVRPFPVHCLGQCSSSVFHQCVVHSSRVFSQLSPNGASSRIFAFCLELLLPGLLAQGVGGGFAWAGVSCPFVRDGCCFGYVAGLDPLRAAGVREFLSEVALWGAGLMSVIHEPSLSKLISLGALLALGVLYWLARGLAEECD